MTASFALLAMVPVDIEIVHFHCASITVEKFVFFECMVHKFFSFIAITVAGESEGN
jgi:hypothetical protein